MSAKPYALSVKGVVLDARGRCLLLRRSQISKANAGKWEFPGGKLDPNERVDEALQREVVEETGLTIVVQRVAGAAESEMTERKIAYLILEALAMTDDVTLSEEHDRFMWVAPEELADTELCTQFRSFAAAYARNVLQPEL
ncbi:MAG: NUDIX hydrolase [Armatimonadota bacterium]